MSEDGEVGVSGYKRKDISGFFQQIRAKQNIEYTSPSGEEYFAKIVNKYKKYGRDNIKGLKREKSFLDYLYSTGVVPKAGELKVYPNGKRARLLLEKLGGDSLGWNPESVGAEIMEQKPEEVILSSALSHQKILEKGVCVVDVNPGTYVVDDRNDMVTTKIVDFELAIFINEESEYDKALRWYRSKDPWLRLSGNRVDQIDPKLLRQEDINLWASTMVDVLLGPTSDWKIFANISPNRVTEYLAAENGIKPMIENEIANETRQSYYKYNPDATGEKEKSVVDSAINTQTPFRIRDATRGLLLDEELNLRNIDLPNEIVNFLKKALSPDIEQRPDSFQDILESDNVA